MAKLGSQIEIDFIFMEFVLQTFIRSANPGRMDAYDLSNPTPNVNSGATEVRGIRPRVQLRDFLFATIDIRYKSRQRARAWS